MQWRDEGYLLSKNNFNENSIIIEAFTLQHGKCSGIVYGGASRKKKKNFQAGNKIMLFWNSKGENKSGYFNIELIKPVSPLFFDDKKRSICILSAISILKILLPERQINRKIYNSLEEFLNKFEDNNWIKLYIYWELSIIKELGFEVNFLNDQKSISQTKKTIEINNIIFNIPQLLLDTDKIASSNFEIKEALAFNKSLLMENFIIPNNLRFPIPRNILEKYYS